MGAGTVMPDRVEAVPVPARLPVVKHRPVMSAVVVPMPRRVVPAVQGARPVLARVVPPGLQPAAPPPVLQVVVATVLRPAPLVLQVVMPPLVPQVMTVSPVPAM